MNDNVKASRLDLISTLTQRLLELDGALACVWAAQKDSNVSALDKQNAISSCRRCLIDLICDIEQLR